ncbi:hypothetical protein [Sporomusa carbonis]|uniref:hypothetical protein n=1 Tax=Sporomusa carbonis TaxID=3076075 RepID=UPI003C7ABB44
MLKRIAQKKTGRYGNQRCRGRIAIISADVNHLLAPFINTAASGIETTAANAEEVSASTEETTATMETISAGAEEISAMANHLKDTVERFTV